MAADSALIARELVQRGVAVVFVLAFAGVVRQWRPLLGADGLTPAAEVVARTSFWQAPSLLRWRPTDAAALASAWVGLLLAALLVVGLPQRAGSIATLAAFLTIWALYLSLVSLGRIWFAFGWESLLCEAGFLVGFLGGHDVAVAWPVLLAVRWLVFRVEVGAGMIKLRGDPCWRELTCLRYHHETQPMPGPFSWYFHHLPDGIHRLEALGNHVVQLGAPWLLFLPQPVAGVGAVAIIVTQGWLLASGNFAWLNLLTIVLAASALPDSWLGWLEGGWLLGDAGVHATTLPVPWVVVVALLSAGLLWRSLPPVRNLLSPRQRMNVSHDPLRLVNSYGAFGSVTRERFELTIEGTEDPTASGGWQAYGFHGKPGPLDRRPRQFAPHHLRLDWLLWFAAMSPDPERQHPWFRQLLRALGEGDPGIRQLLRHDPFDGRSPAALRVRRERYRFTTPAERRETGDWWAVDRR
ncbi:MAG: lipase maturation factor family protein [Nitriliruptor sp.]